MGCLPVHNEELHAIGVGPSIGHAELSSLVVFCAVPHFIRNDVARLTGPRSFGIATLDHESFDDAVEGRAIVTWLAYPLAVQLVGAESASDPYKVGDGDRSLLLVEFAVEGSRGRFHCRDEFAIAGEPLCRVCKSELALEWVIGTDGNLGHLHRRFTRWAGLCGGIGL